MTTTASTVPEEHVPVASATGTAMQHEQAIIEEYGAHVAAHDIYLDGVLAFREGNPVPASHVTRGVVPEDMVTKPAAPAPARTPKATTAPSTTGKDA